MRLLISNRPNKDGYHIIRKVDFDGSHILGWHTVAYEGDIPSHPREYKDGVIVSKPPQRDSVKIAMSVATRALAIKEAIFAQEQIILDPAATESEKAEAQAIKLKLELL